VAFACAIRATLKRDSIELGFFLELDDINVNLKDNDNLTPFVMGSRRGDEPVVKLLRDMGWAEVNSKDK
jgi:hypothetical protein